MLSSRNEQLEKMINKSKEALRKQEHIRKCMRPLPRSHKDYDQTMASFNYEKLSYDLKENLGFEFSLLELNSIEDKKHSCLKEVGQLKPITLKEMQINTIHYGKYLLVKVIAHPYGKEELMKILVEDQDKEIEILFLRYFNPSTAVKYNSILPVGTVLMIKEPNLMIFMSDEFDSVLCIESPTDVLIVNDDSAYSIEKWRLNFSESDFDRLNTVGNSYFLQKEYHRALWYYTQALVVKKDSKCYSNRAAANLNLEKYYDALKDAESSAKLDPLNEKAYYRMAKSLYKMRQYNQALDFFKKCLDIEPKNKLVIEEMEKCESRIEESLTGRYDFKKLIEDNKKYITKHDVADYLSNKLEIVDIANKGKGIIAKDDIKRGTLLVASKAVSFSFDSDLEDDLVTIYHPTDRIYSECQFKNLVDFVNKLKNDPYLAKEIYKLYPGEKFNRNSEVAEGVIDVSRVEAIYAYNSYKFKILDQILQKSIDPTFISYGIWHYPSYINHSCVPNTAKYLIGDLLMIYSLQDIKKGNEITINYTYNGFYDERTKELKCFQFKCDCKNCVVDENDPLRESRDSLLKKNATKIDLMAHQYLSGVQFYPNLNLKFARDFYKEIKDSYKDRQKYCNLIQIPMFLLSVANIHLSNYQKSAEVSHELFNHIKDLDYNLSFFVISRVIMDYCQSKKFKKAKDFYKIMRDYFVGDEEVFRAKFMELCPNPEFFLNS